MSACLSGLVEIPSDPVQVDELAVRKPERPVACQLLPAVFDLTECLGPSGFFREDGVVFHGCRNTAVAQQCSMSNKILQLTLQSLGCP